MFEPVDISRLQINAQPLHDDIEAIGQRDQAVDRHFARPDEKDPKQVVKEEN
jgi:hypothetical protein